MTFDFIFKYYKKNVQSILSENLTFLFSIKKKNSLLYLFVKNKNKKNVVLYLYECAIKNLYLPPSHKSTGIK